jgi:hypothetical protein
LNERDRLSLRQFKDEHKAQQRREREEAERPIREAAAALTATVRQLHATVRERIANGRDEDFTAAEPTATMPIAEAQRFNAENAAKFVATTPEWYPTETNKRALLGYLQRNGCQIATVADYLRAFRRLSEFRLLEERPQLEELPEVKPAPEPIEEQPQATQRSGEMGWDPLTGEPRHYTNKEIAAMSGDEFRRRFRLYKKDLELPVRIW